MAPPSTWRGRSPHFGQTFPARSKHGIIFSDLHFMQHVRGSKVSDSNRWQHARQILGTSFPNASFTLESGWYTYSFRFELVADPNCIFTNSVMYGLPSLHASNENPHGQENMRAQNALLVENMGCFARSAKFVVWEKICGRRRATVWICQMSCEVRICCGREYVKILVI